MVGRLGNSAVSATRAKFAFKWSEFVPVSVRSITVETATDQSEPILLLKIDVQGWESPIIETLQQFFVIYIKKH